MTGQIFEACQSEFPDGNSQVMMECISDRLEGVQNDKDVDMTSFLFVIAGAMIFFMQSGFAMVCAGAVRIKNVQNSMLKNLLDACGAAIAFYLVGKLLMMTMMTMMIMLLKVDKI
jgi:hypothetical protein